jgi:hypothetical protein
MNKPYYIPRGADLRTRFEASYIPEPNSGCWLWIGSAIHQKTNYSRGQLEANGRTRYASQVSYELHVGSIPAGKIICHTCHNPLCVNPEHLYAGTHKQNTADMVRAGRDRRFTAANRPDNRFHMQPRNRLGQFT